MNTIELTEEEKSIIKIFIAEGDFKGRSSYINSLLLDRYNKGKEEGYENGFKDAYNSGLRDGVTSSCLKIHKDLEIYSDSKSACLRVHGELHKLAEIYKYEI